MQLVKDIKDKQIVPKLTPELYDLYAPAVYGKIISIVHKGPIANKILEKVFIAAYANNNNPLSPFQSPLISLLNQAREKSYKTVKALTIFNESCSGRSIKTIDKK
ncbi:MAG: hypothetical protein ABIO04_03545 [Ferruginibacter sp.]